MPLYMDADRRKKELCTTADIFSLKGYVRTSNMIQDCTKILGLDKIPSDILSRLRLIFDEFEQEFIALAPVGKDFRKICFSDISNVVFDGIKKIGQADFGRCLIAIHPLFVSLREGREKIDGIKDVIDRSQSKEEKFYLYSLVYLIFLEAVFDEFVRILYFIHKNAEGFHLKLKNVADIKLEEIKRNFEDKGFKLVFLSNWESTYKHIRNSLAHARFSYDKSKEEIRFQDYNPYTKKMEYNEVMKVKDFYEKGLEVEATVEAFYSIFLLLGVYDRLCASFSI